MPELPSGTVTFLFTDIEGSTPLLHELGDAYGQALAEHRRLLREAFSLHGGVEVDTQGDAFFVVFEKASDAVAAAAEAQQALADGRVRVRMGVHTGEPTLTDEGYVGMDVHRAARVMAAGHGGQVLVSQATRELIQQFPLRDLGEHRLKDLSAPVRLYQLGSELFPTLKTLEQHPTNLPSQPTALVGRERELREVSALLGREDVRLVTLTGSGGTGKTRLALQVAAELLEEFPDGVFFVDLAPISEPPLVLPTVAQTLGLRENGDEPLEQTLERFLSSKALLLVLDNVEQVVAAGPAIAGALKSADALKLLVTSRAPLHLAGEHEYSVSPLPQADAVSLFAERARAVRHDFAPDEAVAEICRRLDGLPLAVELAAARIRLLSPANILERLEQRLSLLTGGSQDAPERQQTLRATLDWSYELLHPNEQRLFARLSVFVGGRTLEAAEEICDADGQLGVDLLDGFATLVENNLLLPDEIANGRPRFRMLETIHAYAREQLQRSGEAEDVRRRHASYFLQLAEQAEPELRGAQQQQWLDLLEAEHDNLRAALSWAREREEYELELRLAGALGRFWYVHAHVREGRAWVESALARERPQAPAIRARALTAASYLAANAGELEQMTAYAEERLQLYGDLGDLHGVAEALSDLGMGASASGDNVKASSLFESSRSLAREAGDRWVMAMVASNLADVALQAGEHERARIEAEQAVALAHEHGLREQLVWALLNLGHATLLGDGPESTSVYGECLSVCREIGAKEPACLALDGLAAALADAGGHAPAVTLLAAAETGRESAGLRTQPFEADLHQRTMQAAQRLLSDAEYADALEAGSAMSIYEAIDFGRAHL